MVMPIEAKVEILLQVPEFQEAPEYVVMEEIFHNLLNGDELNETDSEVTTDCLSRYLPDIDT